MGRKDADLDQASGFEGEMKLDNVMVHFMGPPSP